ncbi:MAG: hypothetical protein VX453_13685 [Acidobacteriota bacterium]|jgi:heterodisulfide reductase subunit A-like polyferredoxin|nr:hypothetical protein [Acidobacteriota bacterium]
MKILYCNCTFAKVVPLEVKKDVLRRLSDSSQAFDAVADLCDMSARKDPALRKIAEGGCTKIAACYPRAVKWLFHAAGNPLPDEGIEVLNMRENSADDIARELLP